MCGESNLILLIEDNPGDQRLIMEALLQERLHYDLRIISDGEEALAAARSIGTDATLPAPSLCILDLHLPRIDGCEVLRALRENPACAEMPIVVLSASISPMDCRVVGTFDNVYPIEKAVSLDDFLSIGRVFRDLLDIAVYSRQ